MGELERNYKNIIASYEHYNKVLEYLTRKNPEINMITTVIKNRRFLFYFLVVAVILVSSLSVLWLTPEQAASGSPPSLLIYAPLFGYMVLITLPIIIKKYEGESFVWGRRFMKGVYLGFILMTMIFLLELASGLIHINEMTPEIKVTLISGIILQAIVALGEELPFRGYVLPDLEKRYGTWNAVFLSSALFSVLHVPSVLTLDVSNANIIIMLVAITVAEVLLALCYLYDGLRMAIGFHFAWNFFQYHVYSLREGFGGMLVISADSPIITGGELGPEAGILGMSVLMIAFIIVFVWLQMKPR
ncbi:MAG: hypothetical protein CVV36_04900 [Candidatus Methanoperedenaceae archaeon HGW-Methanoperedenaceae-1]|nr:MAG: hypothetical protein CVV36_04900 [Candidatus Methanoperedenaceae archaeon HGW-Methanoperedenaceae-1]